MPLLEEGRVCYVGYYLGIENSRWELELTLSATAHSSVSDSGLEQSRYLIHDGVIRGVRSFRVEITPHATAEERQHAFAVDLSCVGGRRGCNKPDEIMPLAWKDFCEQAKEKSYLRPN
jgi:hypothetical protein